MKTTKLFFVFAIALVAFGMTSCKKATYLKSDTESISADISKTDGKIALHSDASSFSVSHQPDWLNAQVLDSTLIYTIAENDSKAIREDSIVIEAGGLTLCIPVKQAYKTTFITPTPANLSFPKEGGNADVDIQTDGGNIEAQCPEFATAEYADGKLSVTVQANNGSALYGEILLTSGDIEASIAISVEGNFCGRCNGTGKITCPKCNGEGIYSRGESYYLCGMCGPGQDEEFNGLGYMMQLAGSGKIKCPDCNGRGK